MTKPWLNSHKRPAPFRWPARTLLVVAVFALSVLSAPTASAYWLSTGSASAVVQTGSFGRTVDHTAVPVAAPSSPSFIPGVYRSTAPLSVTGTVTLDAGGNPDAGFVFQVSADFGTAPGSTVELVNDAQPDNVFWVVAGAVGTGQNSSISGVILAKNSITLGDGTESEAPSAATRPTPQPTPAGPAITASASPTPVDPSAPTLAPDPPATTEPPESADPSGTTGPTVSASA